MSVLVLVLVGLLGIACWRQIASILLAGVLLLLVLGAVYAIQLVSAMPPS